jgi:hypothetical protein
METAQSAQHLKVNLKFAGKPCRTCQLPLEVAADAAICTACHGEHHAGCWQARGGCATPGCVYAPLARLEPSVHAAAQAVMPGHMRCQSCRGEIAANSQFCPLCGIVNSPDGLYHGPKINAPGAVASMVWGIIGLLFCGIILGPVAISKSNSARRLIASNPTYGGGGYATAGMVLGIIDVAFFFIFLMARLGGGSQ